MQSAYLSELESLFSFGHSLPGRKSLESFTSHVWRHFQGRLCARQMSRAEVREDVSLTAKGSGIYPGPWRRFPCVTGTPPSQHETIWTDQVYDENNTKPSNFVRQPSVSLSNPYLTTAVRVCVMIHRPNQTKLASRSSRNVCVKQFGRTECSFTKYQFCKLLLNWVKYQQ